MTQTIIHKNKIQERILKEMKAHFLLYKKELSLNDNILDIGTGVGFTAQHILSQIPSISILGLDVEAHSGYPIAIPRTIYDGKRFPLSDKSFDVSLLFYTLHHVEDPLYVLKETVRVTKRAIFIIEEFELSQVNHETEMAKEARTLDAIGLSKDFYHNHLSEEFFEELLSQAGLTIKNKQRLKTVTTRLLHKYLYIISI